MSHAQDPNARHPRSDAEPMAFTDGELARGAITAGVTFVLVVPAATTLLVLLTTPPQSLGISIYVVLIATLIGVAPATVLFVIAGAPLARAIGRALRRERRSWPHLLAFASLGAVASVLASLVVGLFMWAANAASTGPSPLSFTLPLGLLLAPIAAGSSAFGWWRASRRALTGDAAREVPDRRGD
jgi:cation transport ATPase